MINTKRSGYILSAPYICRLSELPCYRCCCCHYITVHVEFLVVGVSFPVHVATAVSFFADVIVVAGGVDDTVAVFANVVLPSSC